MSNEDDSLPLPYQQAPTLVAHLTCPHCKGTQVALVGEERADASEVSAIPEGLVAVSHAQCQRVTCLAEFSVVTRCQVLRSLSSWTNVSHLLS